MFSAIDNFASSPNDSDDLRFSKRLILILAICCCFCGLCWGLMYYLVFGQRVIMALPLAFTTIVGLSIVISSFTKNHYILIYAQLICITWISACIQWTIGSFDHSGVVIVWSFLGPLGAAIFLNVRQAVLWMGMFLVIVIVSAVYQPALLGTRLIVEDTVKTMFYVVNLGTAGSIVFAALIWFITTIKLEKSKSTNLLQKIQTLFGQHVSKEVALKLIAKDGEQEGGRASVVTVMFLDIRDFTLFADSNEPREVVRFQNQVFSEFINIVRENKGTVNQALGDGILAVFGTPVMTENHPADAINCGLAIIERIREMGEQEIIPKIRLGIGLHTGTIIAGEVGNEFRKFYSLAGTNVIVAARIEQLNKALKTEFLISDTVYALAREGGYQFNSHGFHDLKGLSKPIEIYEVSK